MNTINDLKQRLIDHLYTVDLDKLTLMDLNSYAFTVKTVCEMEQPGYAEVVASMLAMAKRDGGAEDG